MDEKLLFPLYILVCIAEREIKELEWMISYLDMRTENLPTNDNLFVKIRC